jgi:hypothetical protein
MRAAGIGILTNATPVSLILSSRAEGQPRRDRDGDRSANGVMHNAAIDILSDLKDGDSFCKTAMSRREDIVSCIDVTIMDRFAHRALPSSDSKIFPALGAGAAVTRAAVSGGKRFIDFRKPHACVRALVQQHGSKGAPARIEHRLGKSGLGERGGPYSIPKTLRNKGKTVLNTLNHLPLSLAGPKAGVCRAEIR